MKGKYLFIHSTFGHKNKDLVSICYKFKFVEIKKMGLGDPHGRRWRALRLEGQYRQRYRGAHTARWAREDQEAEKGVRGRGKKWMVG